MQPCENKELEHHGILGQKWGIRRYQNKDGTLTEAGKKRAEKIKNEYLTLTGHKQMRSNVVTDVPVPKSSAKDKSPFEMTNEELDDEIVRMKKIIDYKTKYAELNPKKVSLGKQLVDKMLLPAASEGGKKALSTYMEKQLKKTLGVSEKKSKTKYEQLKEEYDILDYEKKLKDLKSPKQKNAIDKLKDEWLEMDYKRKIEELKKQQKSTS